MTFVDALIRYYAGFGNGTDEDGIRFLRTQRLRTIILNCLLNRRWLRQQMSK